MRRDTLYNFQVKFDKKVPLHKKALDNVDRFCDITKMTMRDTIILMLASTNTDYLINQLLNVGNIPAQIYDKDKMKDVEKEKPQEKIQEVISTSTSKNESVETKEDNVVEVISDMNLEDIFDNFSL